MSYEGAILTFERRLETYPMQRHTEGDRLWQQVSEINAPTPLDEVQTVTMRSGHPSKEWRLLKAESTDPHQLPVEPALTDS